MSSTSYSGGGRIRTHGGFHLGAFQERCHNPSRPHPRSISYLYESYTHPDILKSFQRTHDVCRLLVRAG